MQTFNTKLVQNTPTRTEMFEGREYIVVPLVALVEGVHHGSGGAVYYSPKVIAHHCAAWNGVPVTVPHPMDDAGNPISANSPGVLERIRIGSIFNTRFENGKLKMEAWIDKALARRIAPRVLTMIASGQPLEVSTGMFTDDDGAAGTWNSEEFDASITHLIPDHMALLPDAVGACSFDDGCGVRAAKAGKEGKKMGNSKVGRAIDGLLRAFGLRDNETSHEELRDAIQRELDTLDNESWIHMVRRVFDDHFIYVAHTNNPSIGGPVEKLFKQGYSVDDDNKVAFSGDPVEGSIVETFVPLTTQQAAGPPAPTGNTADPPPVPKKEEEPMPNKAAVDALIACDCTHFTEDNREWLEGCDDATLKLLEAKEPPKPPDANADPAPDKEPDKKPDPEPTPDPKTTAVSNEHLAVLQRALDREKNEQALMVAALVANEACKLTQADLEAMPIEQLERTAASFALPTTSPNYAGRAGGPPAPATNDNLVAPDAPNCWDTEQRIATFDARLKDAK